MQTPTLFLMRSQRAIEAAAQDPYLPLAKAVAEDSDALCELSERSEGRPLFWNPVAKSACCEVPAANSGWLKLRRDNTWVPHVTATKGVTLRKIIDNGGPQDQEFENKHPRQTGGKFGAKTTYDKGGEHEIHVDDIGGISAGKGGLHVEHKDGSKRVIPPEKAGDFLTWHGKHVDQKERAEQFVSPNEKTHLSMDDSIGAINSEKQAWLTRTCQDVDKFCGFKSQVMSSVGVWKDPQVGVDTENSTFTVISKVPDAETLKYSAALKGLAANQKAVLNITMDPKGADTIYHVSIPHDTSDVNWKGNLQRIQGAMDKLGLEAATMIRTPHGTDVAVFEQGGTKQIDAAKRLAAFFGATGEDSKCTGEFVGAYKPELDDAAQREASAQEYRSIIYKFEKARGVHYQFKELPPEDQPQSGPMPAMSKPQKVGVGKCLGGLPSLRIINLTRNAPNGSVSAEGK